MELNPLFKSTKVKRDVNDRGGIIGGSSAGAVLGYSTYQSEYEAWKRFMGEEEVVDEETQARFDMGHALEDFIAEQVMRIEGIKLVRDNFAHVNDAHKFLICHPDRMVVGLQDGKRVAAEIKSSSAFDNRRWGAEGTDEVPMDYLIQCFMYFICGVCEEVWLYRFSNNKITKYVIVYDEKLAIKIMDRLVEWKLKVDRGYVPTPTTYAEATDRWNLLTEGDIEADADLSDLYDRLSANKINQKELKDEEDELKAKIVSKMDGKQRLVRNGEKLLTYKQITTTRFDSKSFRIDHPDVYEDYAKKSASMQLRLC